MTREQLLQQYDALEDRVEVSARREMWELADWLADNVPPAQGARTELANPSSQVTLRDLAERRGRSVRWLQQMRRTAETTRPSRMADVALRAYMEALEQAGWDLAAANAAIQTRGPRLRDHGRMESAEATRRQVEQLPPRERARIAREALEDPEVADEVVRTAPGTARSLGARAAEEHPSRQPNPLPGGVPEPEPGFRMEMAGPLSRLRQARDQVVEGWEAGAADAREIERDYVRDTIAGVAASLEAAITSMEVPS